MKKALIVLATFISLVALALPASAIHKGTVCKNFAGPDGPAFGTELDVCLTVNDHDFEDKIQALAIYTNRGDERVAIHVSYTRLIRYSTTIRDTGSFIYTEPGNTAYGFATTWVLNPSGEYHSRIRMWACWVDRPGDPCGSIVTWNSGDAIYQ